MKKYMVIFLLTAVLMIVAFVGVVLQDKETELSLKLTVLNGEKQESIYSWRHEDGSVYIFLPSYAEMEQTLLYTNTTETVEIDSKPVADGMTCSGFQVNTPYQLSYTSFGREVNETITFVMSGNVASMYIDTQSGGMEYIHRKKGNKESGEIRLYTSTGELDYAGGIQSISGRGNATWEYYEKKPYGFSMADEADLLQMGAAQNWILLANADDPSLMRNKIVCDVADFAGLCYSPCMEWVDLYLNGEYAGLYLLSERNEIHAERVNIPADNSYLVSLEWEKRLVEQHITYVMTAEKQALRIHHPQNPETDVKQSILITFQTIENALLENEATNWIHLIDVDSWVQKYLIEEIFANCDACFISQYFYYNPNIDNGMVYAGPVWDYDHSIGNSSLWQFTNPESLIANRLYVREGDMTPWFYRLYRTEAFFNRMVTLYETTLMPAVREWIEVKIPEYASKINEAAGMDHIRWNVDRKMQAEVEYMTEFLEQRLAFLSSVWLEKKEYYEVTVVPGEEDFYAYYAIASGEVMTALPQLPDKEGQHFLGWYYEDTGEPFDARQPITRDVEIIGRWESSAFHTGKQLAKALPVCAIIVFGLGLLVADMRRMRKGG